MTALDFRSGGLADLYAIPISVPRADTPPTTNVVVSSDVRFDQISGASLVGSTSSGRGIRVIDCVDFTLDADVTIDLAQSPRACIRATGIVTINGTIDGDYEGAGGGQRAGDHNGPCPGGGHGGSVYSHGGARDQDNGGLAISGIANALLVGDIPTFPYSGGGGGTGSATPGSSAARVTGGAAGANLVILCRELRGSGTISLNGQNTSGSDGAGGCLSVLCERQLFTGSIDVSSDGDGSDGILELFWLYDEGSVAFDQSIRLERIDPTGREGRLVVR